MRRILIVIAILLATLLAVAAYLVMNIDSVVHSRIERTGSRVAGVPVGIGSVDISLTNGTASLTDLVVANPPGFSDQPAVRFDEISVAIEVTTGTITRVHAGRPTIRVEGTPERTNIDVLRENAAPASTGGTGTRSRDDEASGGDADTNADTGTGGSAEPTGDEDDVSSPTYTIERVEISQASVLVDLDGMDEPESLTIDEFVFTDLEGTRTEIARQMFRQLTDAVRSVVRERLRDAAVEAARAELERRADELKDKARAKLKELLQGN